MRSTFLLALGIWLIATLGVGCRGGDGPSGGARSMPTETVAASVASPSATTTAESYSGAPVDALLIEWKERGGEMIPLDGSLRAAEAPVPLVQVGSAITSPDGSRVAVWDTKGLAVFQIEPWERAGQVDGIGAPPSLRWAPGSERLFTLQYGNLLRELGPAAGSRRQVASVPFGVWSFAPLRGGDSLLVLAYEGKDYAVDVSRVFLALVDTATGEVRGQVDLPGVTLGQRMEKAGAQAYNAMYWPALALSPDGRQAYIAHSDSEAVTVVDLERMAVEKTVSLHAPRSRWERFASAVSGLLVSRAEAKGGLTFRREAVLSPDGRWLYVTGSVARPCGFDACEGDAPAGLWIIDTGTMRVVHREGGINHIALSPGGEIVAGTGVSFTDKGTIGRGVKLLRTGTWELAAHFEPESVIRPPVFSRDGSRLLTLTEAGGLENARYPGGHCNEACYVLRAIDVTSARVVATREVFGHMAEVISLARAGQ